MNFIKSRYFFDLKTRGNSVTRTRFAGIFGIIDALFLLALISLFINAAYAQRFTYCSLTNDTVIEGINPCEENYTTTIFAKVKVTQSGDYLTFQDFAIQQNLTESIDSTPICIATSGPQDDCIKNMSGKTVSGTTMYCDNYPCVVDDLYDCYCYLYAANPILVINPGIDATETNITSTTIVNVGLIDNMPVPFLRNPSTQFSFQDQGAQSLNKRDVSSPDPLNVGLFPIQDNPIVQLTGLNVYIKLPIIATRNVLLQKEDWREIRTIDETDTMLFPIPEQVTIKSGYLQIYLFNEGLISYQSSIPIVGVMYCRLHDCILCWDAIENFHCMSSFYQWIIVTVIILLILSGIALFGGIIMWGLWLAGCILSTPYYFFLNVRGSKFMKSGVAGAKNLQGMFRKPKEKDDVAEQQSSEDEYYTTAARARKPWSSFRNCILICCLIAPSMAARSGRCDRSFSIPMNVTDCLVSGSNTVCQTQLNILALFQSQGQSQCFDLIDPVTNTGHYRLTVAYDVAQDYFRLNNLYYTASWAPAKQYTFRCWTAGACSGTKCAGLDPITNVNAYGELTSPSVLSYPGITTCEGVSTSGCWCFFGTPGCGFYRWALNPTTTAYTVSSLISRAQNYTLSYILEDITNRTKLASGSLRINPNRNASDIYGTSNLNFTIGFAGAFSTNLPILDKKVLTTPTRTYYGPACEANIPRYGEVGDIQSNSPSQLLSASTSAFIFDPRIELTRTLSCDLASSTFSEPGAERPERTMSLLPTIISGVRYEMVGGFIAGNLVSPAPLAVAFITNKAFSFRRTTFTVCPLASLVNVTGCYSCVGGSKAYIKIKSTCMPGLVTITSNRADVEIYTQTSPIELEDTIIEVNFYTPTASNDFTLSFTANGGTSNVRVQFTAVSAVNITAPNYNTTNTTSSPGSSDTTFWDDISDFFTDTIPQFFDDIFSGVADWWEYIIFAVIAVAVLVAASVGVFMIVRFYRMIKMRRGTKKIQ